jgi:hypothetical protein
MQKFTERRTDRRTDGQIDYIHRAIRKAHLSFQLSWAKRFWYTNSNSNLVIIIASNISTANWKVAITLIIFFICNVQCNVNKITTPVSYRIWHVRYGMPHQNTTGTWHWALNTTWNSNNLFLKQAAFCLQYLFLTWSMLRGCASWKTAAMSDIHQ